MSSDGANRAISHHNPLFTGFQLLFNFMLVVIITSSSYLQPTMSKPHPHNNYTDLESLLAFKASVSDPIGLLDANWTTTTDNTSSFCGWIGVYCSPTRQRVIGLQLENVFLHGTISPLLGNLSCLSTLHLGYNNLTGPIPDTLGRLSRLAELKLDSNYLSGQIPSTIFNMSSLTNFSVPKNNLTGSLPSNINLPRLQVIDLDYNQLTGPIPSALGMCPNLQQISFGNNQFSGAIPPELGNITELTLLSVGKQLSGTIPASIGNLTNLILLDLSFNFLQGAIPKELGNLLNLESLNLGPNNLTGSIPTSLLNCTKLNFIQLSHNHLNGPIPASVGEAWPQLTVFAMSYNRLSGSLNFITSLTNCRGLLYIIASGNLIQGILPDTIGNLSAKLRIFAIEGSRINGKIPLGFGNLTNLLLIDLQANQLTGELPSDLSRLRNLQEIYLAQNAISGTIPFELGTMTSLNGIYLQENVLSGSIPDSVANISELQHLYLAGNRLSSSIPDSMWSLKSLIYLNVSQNSLQGSLPMQVGNLKALDALDLSKNRLSGNISRALGDLQMLEYLDLSYNSFHNEIPQSLGRLISIKHLNLSHNLLSGSIPKSLASLRYLTSLNLSYNKLEGQIPQGGVFSNVGTTTSLEGNVDLCGAPQLHFPSCSSIVSPSNSKSKAYLLRYILPPIAFVAVLAFCFYLFLRFRWRTVKGEITPGDDAFLKNHRVISYYELVKATNNFSDANIVGKGGFSSVFKGYLNDGLIVAIKVLNLETRGALKSFDAECYALSMLRHKNLVKIISVCSNLDFKALIFQFMPNGNLEQCLHSDNYLSLLQRMNIMVDVSLAMEYLHHDHPEVIVHCDLKPSNVLFDENMIAYVGDFGIAKLLLGDGKSMMSASTPGTIGYIAPEYGSTGKISRKGDVYSFGILLLETFTKRKPSDAMFGGELSLRKWVSEAYPVGVLKIIDGDLVREDVNTEQRQEGHTIIHQCLSSVIELGLMCSSELPKERISMREVVPTLQKIKREYLSMLPSA